ncbi:MFS transporter [Geminicoccaceae bacterium 1502E]|nr:MFS transporter [Geminicoccaceae bacterium 1502E]
MARQQAAGWGSGSIITPLRRGLFRSLWSANLVSNFGWLVQTVGAAWLMTSLDGSPDMVALVQTAVQAPIFVLALIAGAVADVWDRRAVLLLAQFWMLAVSVVLALATSWGLVTPWLLLGLTFALGMGTALQGPAFQGVVRELVPTEELPAAVTLNAVAFNFARAVGPAIGGAIVATAGAQGAFIFNALSYVALIVVLLMWRRPPPGDDLPRERIGRAIVTGLRYFSETPPIRVTTLRSAVFATGAAAPLALLPLVARDMLGGGPVDFGLLLGAFGAGAMGSAFLVHPLRQRIGAERVVLLLTTLYGLSLAAVAIFPYYVPIMLALALAGGAWLGSFSTFNISVQLSAALWVQARVFSLYQMVMFGAMAAASWFWGWLAEDVSLEGSLLAAGGLMLASLLLHWRYALPGGRMPDLRPAPRQAEPVPAILLADNDGPVLVTIDYRVGMANATAFARAMEEVGHLRRRNGASTWRLFQDATDAAHWTEVFTIASWLDYRRQARRATTADHGIEQAARDFHEGAEPPAIRHMIARHLH